MRDGGKSDVASFGFDGDGEPWLDHLVEALAPREVGSIGPYEVIEEVARGGQGVVYRARQVGTRREIALKRLVEGRHASPSALRRFEREIEVAATLDHPGVVTVYGVETVDGVPMVAMQWIDGVSRNSTRRSVRRSTAKGTWPGPRRRSRARSRSPRSTTSASPPASAPGAGSD